MKVFYIEGGLGRAISSLPSLLKYNQKHSEEEWYIIIPGWDYVTLGIPELQDRTFNPDTKGVWENIFLRSDEVITPEPYRLPNFYKEKISLSEAFDEIINQTNDHSDLNYETLNVSYSEVRKGQEVIYNAYEIQKKEKTIVINPYGSTTQISKLGIYDDTLRFIPEEIFVKICDILSDKYNIIYMGFNRFLAEKNKNIFAPMPELHIREWMGVISQVDYFVGCDSAGQHIARATGTKGCVFFGGTNPETMSYPDYFRIAQRKKSSYAPMRISQLETNLSDRKNKECIEYTDDEIIEICKKIEEDIESNLYDED